VENFEVGGGAVKGCGGGSRAMTVRAAAVAGLFYPADAAELAAEVDGHLAAGRARAVHAGAAVPKALIVPHAGYMYSGPIAGTGYGALCEGAAQIRRVVLLGPAHRVRVAGLAASTASAFATPLGAVAVEHGPVAPLLSSGAVCELDLAHAAEHSLEVQLPFLQRVLGDLTIVPLAVGGASDEQVADVLDALWGGPETLLVVSSDLSHYYDYDTAVRLDAETADAIVDLAPERLGRDAACGRMAIGGLLLAAARNALRPRLLDLRNSGDTAGARDEVVGYGAFAFA